MDEEDDLWKQFLEQDDDADDLPAHSQILSDSYLIGFIIANIVGLRYYSGTINGRELVGLVREPLNPFDPNAIKVLNTRTAQVGHIERDVAAVLAPLIDSRIISAVEAIVPKPPPKGRNPYRLPCQIHIFALPDAIPTVQCAIEDAGFLIFTPTDHEFASSESVTAKESSSDERRRIDEIFALEEKQGEKIEQLEPPKDIVVTELFPHQKEGLGWLVRRENSQDLPPFWKKKDGVFLNVLTNHETEEPPDRIRGGIFADDMGLGKTLTLLSLIASNKPGAGTKKRNSRKRHKGGKDEEDSGPKATLVVCPSSVLTTWIDQLEQHTRPGALQVYLYHGERTKKAGVLLRHDIVLTTYKTLALEFNCQQQSPLKEIEWLRVILDEAHIIKNFASQQTKAVVGLNAERRWVVTGTPIQNSSFDLFSLMAFLRFLPFSIKSYWQSLVQRPLDQGNTSGISRLQALMGSISLRRMKEAQNGSNNNNLVGLPPKTVETCLVDLFPEEREQYEKMESEAKSTLREYINADAVLRNYSTVLHIILRLRQICNCVALCPSDLKSLLASSTLEDVSKNPELLKKLASMLQDGDDFDCPVCLSPPTTTIITRCAHIFCRSCILKTLKSLNPRCPICRQPLSESDLFSTPKPSKSPDADNPIPGMDACSPISSKASALLSLLLASKASKSVVFSQFRRMLVLLEAPLRVAGFRVLRLDGSMSTKKRVEVMKDFGAAYEEGSTVLLASLRAAGTGINLTAASRVYLVEPWWNPAVEEQAMDRVHRIGQREEVRVVRLIVKDSIEERILELQERKKKLAGGIFVKKADKDQRRTRVEDICAMLRV